MDPSHRRVADLLAVESAVLEELADDLVSDGLDEHARRIRDALAVVDDAELGTLDKVRHVVVELRPVHAALVEAKLKELADGLHRIRRRLAYEADKLLHQTQRLSTGEYKPVDD